MRLNAFIATRLYKNKQSSFSSIVQKIAIITISLGLAVMISSYMILDGFQESIKNKIYQVSGHVQVKKYTFGNNLANNPISINFDSIFSVNEVRHVDFVQRFAYKPALLKSEQEISGVIFKGIGNEFDRGLIEEQMVAGEFIDFDRKDGFSRQVVISQLLAERLQVNVDSTLLFFFIQEPPRYRLLRVAGIYNTEMEEIDEKVVIGDLALVQELNRWDTTQVGGYEIFKRRQSSVRQVEDEVLELTGYNYRVDRASELFSAVFDWLSLINRNATLVLVLTLVVASFNLISVLVILSMERTRMIGLLKSLGGSNRMIRSIFLQIGLRLIYQGMLYGNLIALAFGISQHYFRLIPLDAENYYISYVPVSFDFSIIIGLNLLMLVIIGLVLIIPTSLISRTSPVKALRFD